MKRKKKCLRCGLYHLIVRFKDNSNMLDGFNPTCLDCKNLNDEEVPYHYFSKDYKRKLEATKAAERKRVGTPSTLFVSRVPYKPAEDKTYYRNNGHPHIKSFGSLC